MFCDSWLAVLINNECIPTFEMFFLFVCLFVSWHIIIAKPTQVLCIKIENKKKKRIVMFTK